MSKPEVKYQKDWMKSFEGLDDKIPEAEKWRPIGRSSILVLLIGSRKIFRSAPLRRGFLCLVRRHETTGARSAAHHRKFHEGGFGNKKGVLATLATYPTHIRDHEKEEDFKKRDSSGVVTLTPSKRTSGRFGRRTGSSSNVGHSFPFRHGVEAVEMGGRGGAAGARWNEKIADGREDTDEPLQVPGRSKALHRPFASPERQMRILRPIVEPLMRAVLDVRHDLTPGGR